MKTTVLGALMLMLVAYANHAWAGTAFFKYERVSGLNKICYYDYLGSEVAITLRATDLCPLTINV